MSVTPHGARREKPRRADRSNAATGDGRSQIGGASRRIACELLTKVIRGGRPLDDALTDKQTPDGFDGFDGLADHDRAFVRAIVGTALRRRGQIAAIIDQLLEKPIPEKTGAVLDILHIALAQILFMKVPDRAAVSTAVDLAQAHPRARRYKALVNAVLRRAARDRDTLLTETSQAWRTVPVWLFAAWQKAYGEKIAQEIARMHLIEPNLDLTVKHDADGWAGRLGGRVMNEGTVRLARHQGGVDTIAGFDEGSWWVQDVAAALPARLLKNVRGKRVADLCAAPGGKTAQLAQAGAKVTAIDVSKARLERLKANLGRLKLDATVIAADILEYEPNERFDAILLDAPCSATGTIRRHPEVSWNRRPEDIAVFAERQAILLRRAADWLAPGGILVYCTCSLESLEGEDQITAFLADRPDFMRVPVRETETGIPGSVTPTGDLRTLPSMLPADPASHGGLDGFFAARLTRV